MPERYVGQSLGRFRIESFIGSGGFAWVYKGYDPQLEIPVAVKVLKPQFAGDEAFESRFRREASIAAKLRHPNIIRILDVGQQESAVYFVMDYLPHGMVDRLRVMGVLPQSLVLKIGMDVASALAFAHREGVIHRDIKADNILFDEHGNSVVADFGIARAVVGYVKETGTNMVVGTPQYFSPEQARGLALDGRADIYSLGVTLFKGATNTLPFDGEDWYEIARQHVEDPPPRPRDINPAIAPELEAIILRCLEKNPDDRFANAEALYEALATFAQGAADLTQVRTLELPRYISSGSMRALTTPADAAPPPRLRRIAFAAVGVAVLGVLGTAAGFALGRHRAFARASPADSTPTAAPARPVAAESTTARSSAADSTRAHATRPATAPPVQHRTLIVHAPEEATVSIDGAVVGRGDVRRDSIKAGGHTIAASIAPGIQGCPSARQTKKVVVPDSGTRTVSVHPRACGWLELQTDAKGASYAVRADEDGATVRGPYEPPFVRLVLPVGTYNVTVSKELCFAFRADTVRVPVGVTKLVRAPLVCPQQHP